jgi:hypothetical protein
MKAKPGDRVVVDRHRPGDVERRGEILEVRGKEDAPRYLVRWSDGHESVFVPGSDATIEPRDPGS